MTQRVVGLITEYNPFHNGHLHHLRESLRITGAGASVAVMSGHFLQRGEPALLDKWLRTEMALAAGVDLVLELPFPFACNSAPHFAMGAVRTLASLGVVDALCFGSEAGELRPLADIARLLVDRAETVAATTAGRLREGVAYPAARAEVLAALAPDLPAALIASPNNILGIEYLKALYETGGSLEVFTVPRIGAAYHSAAIAGPIASATGIRRLVAEGGRFDGLMPESGAQILGCAVAAGRMLDQQRLFTALQSLLLQETERHRGIYQVEDGLAERLADAAMTAVTYAGLVDAARSRQWTRTRIQRILSYVLMQVQGDLMRDFLRHGPLYLRLLGASERGRAVLACARSRKLLPIVADPARAPAVLRRFYRDRPESCRLASQMLACDLRATRLHGLLQAHQPPGHRNRDFFCPVVQT